MANMDHMLGAKLRLIIEVILVPQSTTLGCPQQGKQQRHEQGDHYPLTSVFYRFELSSKGNNNNMIEHSIDYPTRLQMTKTKKQTIRV